MKFRISVIVMSVLFVICDLGFFSKTYRIGAFAAVFVLLALVELMAPRRRLLTSKAHRWLANLTIVALNPLCVALVFPILPTGLL